MDEQKIRQDLGLLLWEDLKKQIAAECEKMGSMSPVAPHFIETNKYSITLQGAKNGRRTSLTYDLRVPFVFYRTPRREGRMDIRVNPDGKSADFVIHGMHQMLHDLVFNFVSEMVGN
jgi:hypothetical protein